MSNLYQTLRDRQQAEVNDYLKKGAFFAFSDKQFKAGLEKLGRQEALDDPETGRQFAFDMFYYELCNHEFCLTEDPEETLDALGFTWEDIKASAILSQELNRAENEIMKNAQENGFI